MADVEEEEAPPETVDDQNGEQEAKEDLEGKGEDENEDADEQGEEEQESEEEEKDLFELLNESEEDDEEEQAMYKEYLEVIKEIDTQNMIIKDLKAESTRLMYKKCKTYKDKQEYKRLRACQDQEDIHLRALVNRAIQLQNFGSPRRYGDVEMEVTETEQSYFFTALQSSSSGTCIVHSDAESCQECCFLDSDSDSDYAPCCS
ncbi:cilia- and flagella-associated protein 251 [Drosophila rhopaloa]|uniref:Myelin transcription factor 1-like protein n=1 Tax=Drosophila rhopaloa TaxID=1041015 RepID=A0ABM5GTX1_DRORH|nr:cilia- and flagella-associated protein 251 [Drosophila rhopaloa]